MMRGRSVLICVAVLALTAFPWTAARSQERVSVSYASIGATNAIWNIAKERGFYKRHGLDVEVVYIGSTTISVAAILAENVPVGMAGGSGVANAAVRGSDLVSVACFINTLDFDLVVQASIKAPEDLKGKAIGISRFGSVSDVAARELLKGLGLKPMEDVNIRQVGGAPERVPYTTRQGMKIQLEQARKAIPASKVTLDDLIDDGIVREIEREGFIDRLYGKKG